MSPPIVKAPAPKQRPAAGPKKQKKRPDPVTGAFFILPGRGGSVIQQDGHLLFLGKVQGPPEQGKGKLGQGKGIVFGVLPDALGVQLALRPIDGVGGVALGVGPGQDGLLRGCRASDGSGCPP